MDVKKGSKHCIPFRGVSYDLTELLKLPAKQQSIHRPEICVDCNNLVYIFSNSKNSVIEKVLII